MGDCSSILLDKQGSRTGVGRQMTSGLALAEAAWAVFVRETRSELRERHALSSLVVFALVTLTAVSLGMRGDRIDSPPVAAGLFWTVQFFTAMSALSRSFVREEDARTSLALRIGAPALAVYLGKLAFNFLLAVALNILLFPGFLLLITRTVTSIRLLAAVTLLGSVSLAAASTILGAIAARSGSRATLFAVLAFPILLPILVPAIQATSIAFGGVGGIATAVDDLRFVLSYGIISVIAALMLFPLVWGA